MQALHEDIYQKTIKNKTKNDHIEFLYQLYDLAETEATSKFDDDHEPDNDTEIGKDNNN